MFFLLYVLRLSFGFIYGEQYLTSVPVLMILIWSRWFSLLGVARNIWMVCENKSRYVKWFIGAGAILNVILNYYLIPIWGAAGAAAATLVTELLSSFLLVGVVKETRPLFRLMIEAFLLRGIKKDS